MPAEVSSASASSGVRMQQHPSERAKLTNSQLGMLVAIASFTMLFGTMLLSYLLIRARQNVWPPIGVEPLDKQITTLSTIVLLGSSIFVHHAIKALRNSNFAQFKKYWSIGTWSGLVFLAMQSVFVMQMWQQGLRVESGIFASISYTLVVFHALHVIVAWGWMLAVHLKSLAGAYKTPTVQNPVLASWMWHFLDVVWVLTCVLLVWY
ncbi:hypothetical protein GW916_01165 [bacterium]|nr:hypothetical protein [bacterium]